MATGPARRQGRRAPGHGPVDRCRQAHKPPPTPGSCSYTCSIDQQYNDPRTPCQDDIREPASGHPAYRRGVSTNEPHEPHETRQTRREAPTYRGDHDDEAKARCSAATSPRTLGRYRSAMTPQPDQGARDAVLAHPAVVRVREAIAAHLVTTTMVVLDGAARTAAQAAEQLGVAVAQIANSLVFTARTTPDAAVTPLLVLASGVHRVDTVKVAAMLQIAEIGKADADFVRASTGFVIGGVAPVGHTHPIRTVVDVSLARYDTIWAAAGHPQAVFRTTYDELIRMSGGIPAEVV